LNVVESIFEFILRVLLEILCYGTGVKLVKVFAPYLKVDNYQKRSKKTKDKLFYKVGTTKYIDAELVTFFGLMFWIILGGLVIWITLY